MKLIVGLGNPGKQYDLTRHNVGFLIIDIFCETLKITLNQNKFNGQYLKTVVNDVDVIFLKPLTYMNLSGNCVRDFMCYFKILPENVLIIHDEVDLNFGQFQYKKKSGSAGHNGIKDIFLKTKINSFSRLRIGVGRDEHMNTADWVLSKFSKQEVLFISNSKEFFIASITDWITSNNFELIMNKYNKK